MGSTGQVDLLPALGVLTDPAVMLAAGVMYFVEFFADKTPGVDSGWDAIHTLIRIPAGAIMAAGAAQGLDIGPAAELVAGLLGGTFAATSHATKAGKVAGFSLHAGVAARADQRDKLERLCRYICRPAVSERRLSLTPNGNVRYELKTPSLARPVRAHCVRLNSFLMNLSRRVRTGPGAGASGPSDLRVVCDRQIFGEGLGQESPRVGTGLPQER